MRSFKRALASALCFLCVIAAVSGVLLHLRDVESAPDRGERAALAGTVDLLVVGSSHAKNGIVPSILDEELGCTSYNLSSWVVPMYAKRVLTEKELARNSVRTVLIEIAYDTLTRDNSTDFCEGDEAVLFRLDTWAERFRYAREFLSLNDCLNVYSRSLYRSALNTFMRFAREQTYPELRGYVGKDAISMVLREDRIVPYYQRDVFSAADYRPRNIEDLRALIAVCRRYGADPVVVSVPTSDNFLWTKGNMDEYRRWMEDFCREEGCAFWDFDLLRERYTLFGDERSFLDVTHMSDEGAHVFTHVLGEVLRRDAAGEDMSALFYDSYARLLEDSPYMARYLASSEN